MIAQRQARIGAHLQRVQTKRIEASSFLKPPAAVASDATSKALQVGVASPVAGLFSNTASQKSALLNQPLTDGLYNIMFGRDAISALDGLVAQWRANGGDQIRSELQDALQKRE